MTSEGPSDDARKQEIVAKTELHSTRWLRLVDLEYTRAPWDRTRHWQAVERVRSTPKPEGATDAVCVLALVKGSHIVVVKQYRPPTGKYTVELPAGLVDEGETFQAAALRELKEETGYTGTVVGHTGVQYLSPGITDECVRTVTVQVDNADQAEQLVQDSDDAMYIGVALLPLSSLTQELQGLEARGYGIKAMLYAFAQGLDMARLVSNKNVENDQAS